MAQVELICYAQRVVKVEQFLYGSTAIVGMQGMVDETAFNHHEELLGRYLLQVVQASLCDEGQCEVALYAVYGVTYVGEVVGLVEQYHLVAMLLLVPLGRTVYNGVAGIA